MVNAVKQANEFGLTQHQTMATLLVFLSDVRSMQLQAAQGLKFVTGFYWDCDDETRAWSKRFLARQGKMPTQVQASIYSAVRHYLGAIASAGTDEPGGDGEDAPDTGRRFLCQGRAICERTAAWFTTCISHK